MFKMAIFNHSRLCKNLKGILNSINMSMHECFNKNSKDLCTRIVKRWQDRCVEEDIRKGCQVRELNDMRDNILINSDYILNRNELNCIVADLCTSVQQYDG